MSSALDTARATIETDIASSWSATPIIWPNEPTSPPETGRWIQPWILWGDGFLSTKNGRNTVVGVLNINVYAPAGSGTGELFGTADSARDLFNRMETGSVRFGAPSGPRIVPNPDSKWIQAAVTIPFTVDEIVS